MLKEKTPCKDDTVLINFLKDVKFSELQDDSQVFGGVQYYIPKALCIVSESPYFNEFKNLLGALYFKSKRDTSFPFGSYLHYITFTVPKPGRGYIVNAASPEGSTIRFKNKSKHKLPSIQVEFYWDVFTKKEFAQSDNFNTILYWFMCQVGSTVLISSSPNKLIIVVIKYYVDKMWPS